MDENERKDIEWMVKHGTQDLNAAHEARLKVESEIAESAQETRRIVREQAKAEKEERLRGILAQHPDRFCVSINGRRILPDKKGRFSFECACGTELPEILEHLGDVLEHTFAELWLDDFTNGDGRSRGYNSETTCPQCKARCLYRVLSLPY